MKTKRIVKDIKTGEERTEEFEYQQIAVPEIEKAIDPTKLKKILESKGIIKNKEEIE